MKAIWHDTVIAESGDTIPVEGNYYFPSTSVKPGYLRTSSTHTVCPWKGRASYFDVVVGDAVNHDAAWYYPEPKEAALNIKGYLAFWRGVKVVE